MSLQIVYVFWPTCVFVGCAFAWCVFAGCAFTGCVFTVCIFAESVFAGCVFAGCVFAGSVFVGLSSLGVCDLAGCVLAGCVTSLGAPPLPVCSLGVCHRWVSLRWLCLRWVCLSVFAGCVIVSALGVYSCLCWVCFRVFAGDPLKPGGVSLGEEVVAQHPGHHRCSSRPLLLLSPHPQQRLARGNRCCRGGGAGCCRTCVSCSPPGESNYHPFPLHSLSQRSHLQSQMSHLQSHFLKGSGTKKDSYICETAIALGNRSSSSSVSLSSSLPYCEGRLGTADDSTTSFLHFPLFSTTLWDLVNSRPSIP